MVRYLTGSIGSTVGPAVIKILFPFKDEEENESAIADAISYGSDILPSPISPHACSPLSGPIKLIFFILRVSTFICVTLSCHIFVFIAGAINNSASEANITALIKSLARP